MSRTQRAGFTGALAATMGTAALLTSSVSALGPQLRQDLGLTTAALGLFAMTVFLTTAALSIPFGRLVDRSAHTVGLVATFLLAAAAVLGAALSQSLTGLLMAAAAGGGALAMSGAVTNRLVSDYIEAARRNRTVAMKQTGVQIGQMAAGLLCPLVAVYFGWRAGLASLVAVVVVMLVLVLIATRTYPVSSPAAPGRAGLATGPAAQVRPGRLLFVLSLYALLTGICFQATLFGLPLAGHEMLRFDLRTASLAVVVLGAAGFAARLAWGLAADQSLRVRGQMAAIAAALFIGEALILWAVITHASWVFWAGTALFGAGFALVPVVLASAVLQHYPVSSVGMMSGVVSVSTFSGFAAGPFLFGLAVDYSGYRLAWLSLLLIALASGLVPWLMSRHRPGSSESPKVGVCSSTASKDRPAITPAGPFHSHH